MKLIDRLEELKAKIDPMHDDEIRCDAGWPEYIYEVEKSLPKFIAFVQAYDEFSKTDSVDLVLFDRMYDARKALDQES